MPGLLTDDEVYEYLDIDRATDDPNGVALSIRDAVENHLETLTSRTFGPSVEIVDEVTNGEGTRKVFTKHPIESITSINIRYGVYEEPEYYGIDILDGVSFRDGERRIYSRNVPFPRGVDNVYITYDTKADLPELAKQAVREAVAATFRKIGSEDNRSERVGTYTHVMLRGLDELLTWKSAVNLLTVPFVG